MDRSGRQQVFELDPTSQQTIVGRHPDCDLVSPDASVSRRHCMIQFDGEHFRVSDLGSANGTMVNDVRISRRHLGARDIVRCGSLILQFFEDEAEGVTAAPAEAPRPRYGHDGPVPATAVTPAPGDELVHLRTEVRRLNQFNDTQGERLGALQDEMLRAEQRADTAQKRVAGAEQDAEALRTRVGVLETAAEKREELLRAREAEINALAHRLGVGSSGTSPSVHETMDLPSQPSADYDPPTEVAMPALVFGDPAQKTSPSVDISEEVALEMARLAAENEALKAQLAQLHETAAIGEARMADDMKAPDDDVTEVLRVRVDELEEEIKRRVGELDAARAGHFATDAERTARLTSLEYEVDAADGRFAASEALLELRQAELGEASAWLEAAGERLGEAVDPEALAEAQSRAAAADELEAELHEARAAVAKLEVVEGELDAARAQLERMPALEAELADAREQLDSATDTEASLNAASERLKALEGIEAEVNASREMVAHLEQVEADLSDARGQLASLDEVNAELESLRDGVGAAEEAKAEALDRATRFEELSAELEAAKLEIGELRKSENSLKAAVSEARAAVKGAARSRGELKKRQKELDELLAKVDSLTDVDDQRNAMAESLAATFGKLKDAHTRIGELQTANEKPPDEDSLQGRLRTTEQALIAMEQRAQEAETALVQLREHEQSNLQADSETAKRMEAMQFQLGAVTRRAKMMRAQAQAAEASDARLVALKQQVSDVKDERDLAEQHTLGLIAENNALKSELEALKAASDAAAAEPDGPASSAEDAPS